MLGFVKHHAASVGAAVVRLLDAEWQELQHELRNSQSEAKRASVRFGVAGGLLFLGAGALVFSAIAGLSRVIPDWAAGLAVGAVLLAAGGIAWWAARQRMAKIEPPGTTVKRRVDEHLSFWRGEFEGAALGDGRARERRRAQPERGAADEDGTEGEPERIAWRSGRQPPGRGDSEGGDSGRRDFDDIPDQSW